MARPVSWMMIILSLLSLLLVSAFPGVAGADTSRFQRTSLANGLVILVAEDHSLPFVTMKLLVDGGSKNDPAGREGLARLTSRGILMGTERRTAPLISRALDFMGAELTTNAGKDFAVINLRILRKDIEKGLDLFLDVLTRSDFPEAEVSHEIERTLSAIQLGDERPGRVAEKEFQKAIYLKTPYGHPVEGTRTSVPALTRDGLIGFYRQYYRPNNAILAVAGDITPGEIKERLIPLLEAWQPAGLPGVSVQDPYGKGPRTLKVDRSITQANVIIGNKGLSRSNPDYYPAMVMNYILGGGGFSSRLMEDIRNKRGLAYSVASDFEAGRLPGAFQVTLQTKNSSARDAIALTLKEMERIRTDLVSGGELEGAKKYLIGSFPMRLDSQAKVTRFLLMVEYYGLGLDYAEKYPALIRAVTREDVLRVARAYLDPKDPIIVIVADLKEAGLE